MFAEKGAQPVRKFLEQFEHEKPVTEYNPENVASSSRSSYPPELEQWFNQPAQSKPSAQGEPLPPLQSFELQRNPAKENWVEEFAPKENWVEEFNPRVSPRKTLTEKPILANWIPNFSKYGPEVVNLLSNPDNNAIFNSIVKSGGRDLNFHLNTSNMSEQDQVLTMMYIAENDKVIRTFYNRGIRPSLRFVANHVKPSTLIKFIKIYPPDFEFYHELLSTTTSSELATFLLKIIEPINPQRLIPIVESNYWKSRLAGHPVTLQQAINNHDVLYLRNNGEIDPGLMIEYKQFDLYKDYADSVAISDLLFYNAPVEVLMKIYDLNPDVFRNLNNTDPDLGSPEIETNLFMHKVDPEYEIYNKDNLNNYDQVSELIRLGYPITKRALNYVVDNLNVPIMELFLQHLPPNVEFPYEQLVHVSSKYTPIVKYILEKYPPKHPLSYFNDLISPQIKELLENMFVAGPDPIDDLVNSEVYNEALSLFLKYINEGYPVTYETLVKAKYDDYVFNLLLNHIQLTLPQEVDLMLNYNVPVLLYNHGIRPPLELLVNTDPDLNPEVLKVYPKNVDLYTDLINRTNNPRTFTYLLACGIFPTVEPHFKLTTYWKNRLNGIYTDDIDVALHNRDGFIVNELLTPENIKRYPVRILNILLQDKIYSRIPEIIYNSLHDPRKTSTLYHMILLDRNVPVGLLREINRFYNPTDIVLPANLESIRYLTEIHPELRTEVFNEMVLDNPTLVKKLIELGYPISEEQLEEAIIGNNIKSFKYLLQNYNGQPPYETAIEHDNWIALRDLIDKFPKNPNDLIRKAENHPDLVKLLERYYPLYVKKQSQKFFQLNSEYWKAKKPETLESMKNILLNSDKLLAPIKEVKIPASLQELYDRIPKQYPTRL